MQALASPRWPALVVRGIALWVLAGATFKLLWGTPADLPRFLREALSDPTLSYRLLIVVETFVGLFALMRPGRAWPLVLLLLAAFVGGLVVQITEGETSCGCFGAKLPVPPAAMLALDGALFLLLLGLRPWRLAATRARRDVGFAAVALVLALVAPFAIDREGRAVGPLRPFPYLYVHQWVGKDLGETELARWIDVSQAVDGLWFLYRDSCEVCAACLVRLAMHERGDREVTLVRLGEPPADHERKVHQLPEGPWVHRFDLPDTADWQMEAPSDMLVENGRVVRARHGIDPQECFGP
jgi:hypothetical protein